MNMINSLNDAINLYTEHHGVPPAQINMTQAGFDSLLAQFDALLGKRHTRTDVRYRGIPFVIVAPAD